MTGSETWKRAEELYHAALQQDEARRAAFVEEACAGDEMLLREVRSLLGYAESAERFLEGPAAEAATQKAAGPRAAVVGQQIGHFVIVSRIGSGGMGEVYRARDLSLGREVAVKLMQRELSSDTERLRRFEREARAAAALSHPNIATVHEIGEHQGTRFIAMELVEGLRLDELLARGPLPVEEVLHLGTQVAAGLAKAHAAGIVHRDLKPANLMVTDEGLVKILDFGLARRTPETPGASSEITREGSILGTVPYMSPEQAAGRPVDHRSDQFSFGSILYEMATGRRAFQRDTTAQTLAAILQEEPRPLGEVKTGIPARLTGIVERCLSKDPRGRYDSTGDLAKELEQESADSSVASPRRPKRWRAVVAVASLALAVATVAYWSTSRPDATRPSLTPLQAVPLTSYPGREAEPTFSPDGSQVAFAWNGEGEDNWDIYVKVVGAEQPLRLTTDSARDGSPAWSPDGRQIAFLRQRPEGGSEVRLVSPTGGSERRIAEVGARAWNGLSWSPDGRILAVPDRSAPGESLGIFLLHAETSVKERLTSPSSAARTGDAQPVFSPDGRAVAFIRRGSATVQHLCVVPAAGGRPRQLAPTWPATRNRLAWTPAGEEIIFAAFLEPAAVPPRPSTRFVADSSLGLWRISPDGGSARRLVGIANALGVAVSRRGARLAYAQQEREWDIWRLDLRRSMGEPQTRFISSTRAEANPQFSPDDERVAFSSARSGAWEIWVADNAGANLLQLTSLGGAGNAGSPRWSPDGKTIAFDFVPEGSSDFDVYVVDVSGGPARRITRSPSADVTPSWSGDGSWIYFGSDRSGRWEIWKVPSTAEEEGNARQVTREGGFAPIESTDGEYVYFCKIRHPGDPESAMWRMPVRGGEEEVVISSLRSSWSNWAVAADGIYFVDREKASSAEEYWAIKFLASDDGRVTEVSRLRYPPINGPALSVSSDGRWILSAQSREASDLMLVENFR